MSKISDKIKVLLGIAKHTFGQISTDKGVIFFDGDEISAESKVYTEDGSPVEDGEYADETRVVVVKDSVVTEIRPKNEEKEEKTEEKTTETTETTEKTEEKMAGEETTTDEVKEEIKEEVKENADEPSFEDRLAALEELCAQIMDELRQMKVREVESVAKNEEIIREFNAFKSSPTATSVTAGCEGKEKKENLECEPKSEILKKLKGLK